MTDANLVEKKSSYNDVKDVVEKPLGERSLVKTARGNMRKPRRYHMTDKKLQKVMDAASEAGTFPNPYRKGGMYYAIVQSLIALGIDTSHSFAQMRSKIQEILSAETTGSGENSWDKFVNRSPRNALSAKDCNGRIMQNAQVLQRLTGSHPYGEQLRQLSACIDILKGDNDIPCFRLNTQFDLAEDVSPINELKKKRGKKTKSKTQQVVDETLVVSQEDVIKAPAENVS